MGARKSHTTRLALTVIASSTLFGCGTTPTRLAHVRLGVDRLADSIPSVLAGKRVGLITNHSGANRAGRSTIDLLAARTDLKLVALFAPEHGIRGTESGTIAFMTDSATGLPVHSLYGQNRQPTPEMLQGVDALVFDIQDVGVRQYTYPTTMYYGMMAAKAKGIPFVVLDRPTPVTGTIVEGNILETPYSNFAGFYANASRHGMTVGELARMANGHFGIGANLTVVPMVGWTRDLWMDETDLPWKRPSPNLPYFEGTIHYPGTVLFEGTNISEGRGSERPFEYIGAPWLRAQEMADSLNARALPGARFEAKDYPIREGGRKYPGEVLHGLHFIAVDRNSYRPIAATLHFMELARKLHPD
ncbi:MAG: exo-beta-N-acetylmuramidase NamZ family protein, partial [Longimicrobiales bacterium]